MHWRFELIRLVGVRCDSDLGASLEMLSKRQAKPGNHASALAQADLVGVIVDRLTAEDLGLQLTDRHTRLGIYKAPAHIGHLVEQRSPCTD
jgi:hypothetical protein